MKDIKLYIKESTQDKDLFDEVGLSLKPFGNVKNGFKMIEKSKIIDAMYKLGFDFVEEDSSNENLVFIGDYIDDKYEVDLYIEKEISDKVQIKNYNVFKI